MNDKDDAYFKDWYAKNGDTLNKSRRSRYHSDPEYKASVLQRNREARQKRREETAEERSHERKATRVRVGAREWKTSEVEITNADGSVSTATLFSIGALARSIGRSVQAVRLWESQGLLPETPLRNAKGDRLYTASDIETIREIMTAKGKISDTSARPRSVPKGIVRVLQYPDGSQQQVPMFRVGVLASAIQRTVVTVEILESRGFIPATPFRAAGTKTKYRLYTLPMIEAVKQAFEARGSEIRGDDNWKAFEADVRAAWDTLHVFGCSLVELPKPSKPQKATPKAKKAKKSKPT